MNKYRPWLSLLGVLCIAYIIHRFLREQFCQLIDINISEKEDRKKLIVILMIVILIIFSFYLFQRYVPQNKEGFDVIIGDIANGRVNAIDLENFFQFIEYFQTNDLSTESRSLTAVCYREGDLINIRNAIINILQMLRFIVNVNNKDNFYHRWMVAKMGSNMEWDEQHPRRKLNYDEMVRNNIGKQFTIMPENQLDLYWPHANLDSKYQNPMPHTINVHDYYTEQNVEVNLLTLKVLLELIQENNPDVFSSIVRPTEHPVFQQEFVAPLKSIIHSMLAIVMTDSYKEYLTKFKFDPKYGSLTFNPLMIRGQFGTF